MATLLEIDFGEALLLLEGVSGFERPESVDLSSVIAPLWVCSLSVRGASL
jgi:hypothetical protein